jgi:putative glutamine amidotransferase
VVLTPRDIDPPDPDVTREMLGGIDGLLLPGGWDVDPCEYGEARPDRLSKIDPALDHMEIALVRGAVDSQVPVFGICRGQQVINVALGGTLLQHVEGHDQHGRPRHELAHEVVVEPDSELRSVVPGGVLEVNSLHHQAVKVPAPALRVTARSHDGVVEGMESRDGLIVAVQCHPEELVERQSWALGLLRRFVERVLRSATTAARG